MRRLGSLLGMSFCASLLLHPLSALASPPKPTPVFWGCPACSYTVQPGDTIWSLAKTFGVPVDSLYSFDHLDSDLLEPGQVLRLPGGSYTVQPGDTIWSLARKLDVSVNVLSSVNHLASEILEPGQVLRLPVWPATGTAPAPDNTSAASSPPKPSPLFWGSPACSYTVQSGDTVWSLAKTFGVSVNSLYSFNHLDSDLLEPGQVLRLPGGSYTVQPGDTIWSLARKLDVSVNVLSSVNHLASEILEPGQVLRLPVWPVTGTSCAFDYGEVSRGAGPLGRLVAFAEKFVGAPYSYAGDSPQGFDCSGFVRFVLAEFGIHVEHSSYAQYGVGVPVPAGQLEPGDLVFFNTYGPISHVGIYVGDGRFISATCSRGVAVESLDDAYWGPRYAGARRL